MIMSAQKRVSGTTLKLRQREVEQRLAMFGLRRGPRLTRKVVSFDESPIRRLRRVLESLGPVFSSFGLYLSTCIDLLAAKDCLELASIPDRAEESSPTAIRDLIKQELGNSPENVYLFFEAKPLVSGLLDQHHRACLRDGQAVTVKLVHPEAEEFLHYDVELLPLLRGAFVGAAWSGSKIESAIDDFCLTLQQRTDFALQAGAVSTLSKDTEVFAMLRAPFVHKQLSTSRILTIERLPGKSVEEVLSSFHVGEGKVNETADGAERLELARRLCVAWLRQALLGSFFPVEPSPSNITILPNKQIAFTSGAFTSLPADAKANVWDYLIAVVNENPDLACSCLLKELVRGNEPVNEDELRRRFRQIVPFRDSEWARGGDQNTLAQYLFLHWRLTSERGYRPRHNLPSFYRGLFMIANLAKRLAPDRDALRDALQDVRLLRGAEKFREMLGTEQLGEQMDKYAAIMTEFPQRLDEALTLLAEGEPRVKLQTPKEAEHQRQRNSLAVSIALSMALGSCALLAHRLAASGVAGAGVDSVSAVVFVLLGAMLLRVVTRGSR